MLKDYAAAITEASTALKFSPKLATAYYVRGLSQFALKNYQAALADYDKVIDSSVQWAEAFVNRGVARFAIGEYKARNQRL